MINNSKFYCPNRDTYPPFKNGLYLEEYFLKRYTEENPKTSRKYIPVLWTNFQIEGWFNSEKESMQKSVDEWIQNNPSEYGYFTVVQYDDGPQLKLPENTLVFGACSGNLPIPLIYEDINNKLQSHSKIKFNDKKILCSFAGSITANHVQPHTRQVMINTLYNNPNIVLHITRGWTPDVDKQNQDIFINLTTNSKFALAPRGYGRSSFRFFEIFQLGTIPVYIYNDVEWLPFKDKIDYSKICISIHVSQINELENILKGISEEKYNDMFQEYEKVKHFFTLEGMYQEIILNNM